MAQIETTGLSQTAFLMFFFAGFAFLATLAFWLYAKRYRVLDNYRRDDGSPRPSTSGDGGTIPQAIAKEK